MDESLGRGFAVKEARGGVLVVLDIRVARNSRRLQGGCLIISHSFHVVPNGERWATRDETYRLRASEVVQCRCRQLEVPLRGSVGCAARETSTFSGSTTKNTRRAAAHCDAYTYLVRALLLIRFVLDRT